MDFKDQLKQIADKVVKFKDSTNTEEATKNAFIMPFLTALGYDIFNPEEVIPEFVADLGIKQGEKVDYAIMKDGSPIILVECKHWRENLDVHNTQLFRYFIVTKAKFAILTNGIIYRFYTDLEEANKMDQKPFLDINLLEIKDNQIEELKKFHKSYFDIHNIITTASTLKYSNEVKLLLANEFKQPSDDFVRYFIPKVFGGRATEKVVKQFTEIVKISCQQFLSDLITERLKTALDKEKAAEPQILEPETKKAVSTTEEEVEAYYVVKTILRQTIDSSRIYYRDFQSFFSILIDDSIRNTICKFYFTDSQKCISIISEDKSEVKYALTGVDEIFKFSDRLIEIGKKYSK